MDLERERGITIKANTVRLDYTARNGETYVLNLIDTPGHVDFAYEVIRSLAACEGSLLVVDASQGVEAQTLANVYQAIDNNHEIMPVLNKVDLPAAEPERVRQQIEDVIGLDASDGDRNLGQDRLWHAGRAGGHRPPPAAAQGRAQRAAQGAARRLLVRSLSRRGRAGAGGRWRAQARASGSSSCRPTPAYQIDRVGIFRPKQEMVDKLGPGEIGFFTAAIKEVADTRVGDTITDEKRPCAQASARVQAGPAGGVRRTSSRRCGTNSKICARRSASSG